jgi:hypothetical protein
VQATAAAVTQSLSLLRNQALAVSGVLTGLVTGGLRGTAEGLALANAFTRLSRTMASIFAPAVRQFTGLVNHLATTLANLDPITRRNIVVAGLAATAVALVTGGLISLVGVIAASATALASLTAVVGAPVVLLGALAVAIVAASTATMSWSEILDSSIDGILAFRDALAAATTTLKKVYGKEQPATTKDAALRGIGYGLNPLRALGDLITGKLFGRPEDSSNNANPEREAIKAELSKLVDALTKGRGVSPTPAFESLQAVFDREQTTLGGAFDPSMQTAENTKQLLAVGRRIVELVTGLQLLRD